MSAAARGIDVSSWQHPGGAPIDWEAVDRSGITFVLVKVSQGASYVNPWGIRDLNDARDAGLMTGAYHFWEAGASPQEQAAHAVGLLIGQQLDLGLYLDWEPPETDVWAASGSVNGFLEAAKDGRPGCGLYCDQSWWAQLKTASVAPPKLWLAAPDLTSAPPGATVWQSGTAQVPGIPSEVDIDMLVGTRGINLPTAPKPKPVPAPKPPVDEPDEPEKDED